MSIIIREVGAPATEWVYLDNTTNYTDRQTKRLTSNPIENRSNVADHGIKDNRKYSISGSISPWDFHLAGGDDRAFADGISAVVNVGRITVNNTISDYLPSSITQYTDFVSDVKVADIVLDIPSVSRETYLNSVKTRLQNLYDSEGLIDVYFCDYTGAGDNLVTSSVITSIVFSEDLNTGDSVRVDIGFEKPTIAYVATSTIPAELEQELASLDNQGGVNGSTITETNNPTAYSQASNALLNFF